MRRILIKEEALIASTFRLAMQLNKSYSSNEDVVCCPVLQGATRFFIDVSRHFSFNPQVEYIGVSSYDGEEQKSFDEYRMPKADKIKDKVVLVFDDILDTGNTMHYLTDRLYSIGAKEVVHVILLKRRDTEYQGHPKVSTTHVCHEIGDEWLWGYGMDAPNGRGRTLGDIFYDEKA